MRTNPFTLTQRMLDDILPQRKATREAEARFDHLLQSYRDIVADERYAPIKADLRVIMGELLNDLVQEASTCADSKLIRLAQRIRMMHEVVGEPLRSVWYAHQVGQDEARTEESDGI